MEVGNSQAFQATNTLVARLNWRVGDGGVKPLDTESLFLSFMMSGAQLRLFKEGCEIKDELSAVAGLASRCRFGWGDGASSRSYSHLSHCSQAVSNILRSADGAEAMIDHKNRSSSALPSEHLSRMSISKLLSRALKSSRVSSKRELLTDSDEFLLLETDGTDFCDGRSIDPDFTRLITELLALRAFA